MATRPCGIALEWWLRGLGKFEGATVTTIESPEGENTFAIKEWVVDGVPQPTDAEIEAIIDGYDQHVANQATEKATAKTALLAKLGIDEADLPALKEILKDV